jgi:plastocyanin
MRTSVAGRLSLAMAALAVLSAGCASGDAGGGGETPVGTPAVGSILGTTAAGAEKVPGTTVILLKGPAGLGVVPTDGNGQFVFDNVAVGTYSLQIQTPAGFEFAPGETGFRPVVDVAAGKATNVAFSLARKALDGVVEVKVKAVTFEPATITIKAGTKVRWISDSPHYHTISMDAPGQVGGWADAVVNSLGAIFEHTFTVPNQTYGYNCAPHKTLGMVGTVIVTP